MEEGKADILGLYMITQLHKKGQITGDLKNYFTTFLAGIFRSVRFGTASAHGQANRVRFNFFAQQGAFVRDAAIGTYRVNFEKREQALHKLSEKILLLQGNDDYTGVKQLLSQQVKISSALQSDLDRLAQAEIPVDAVFEQGQQVLGL